MRILHPLFVHLHIAFLFMAFISMFAWLIRGLATSVFEDRFYRFASANTWAGLGRLRLVSVNIIGFLLGAIHLVAGGPT